MAGFFCCRSHAPREKTKGAIFHRGYRERFLADLEQGCLLCGKGAVGRKQAKACLRRGLCGEDALRHFRPMILRECIRFHAPRKDERCRPLSRQEPACRRLPRDSEMQAYPEGHRVLPRVPLSAVGVCLQTKPFPTFTKTIWPASPLPQCGFSRFRLQHVA